jgi:AraC-like DNA-binding protein
MPRSIASAFTEPSEYQDALHNLGNCSLCVTAPGRFHARLTQISLHNLRLAVVEENLPRIGFLAVPEKDVLISFPLGGHPAPVWGGMTPRTGEFMTVGPGHRLHVRTQGPSSWGAIWFPALELMDYFHVLTECTLAISPFAQQRRPPAAVSRRILHLHAAAIRSGEARPNIIVSAEAAHGMEQQLIEAVVECLLKGQSDERTPAGHRRQGVMIRLEELLRTQQERQLSADELSGAIGVSGRLLRLCCREELGMSPVSYVRLCALHQVRHILRNQGPGGADVSHIARSHGFRHLGRFAATYCSLFGELPSTTMSRNSGQSVAHLVLCN